MTDKEPIPLFFENKTPAGENAKHTNWIKVSDELLPEVRDLARKKRLIKDYGKGSVKALKGEEKTKEKSGIVNISEWCGRLGNNIHQLAQAYLLAEKHGWKVCYPHQDYFLPNDLSDYMHFLSKWHLRPIICADEPLFSTEDFNRDYFKITENDRRRICKDKINNLIRIPSYDVPEDVIVFHIRTGDVFRPDAHPGFLQPPLAFYISVIEKESIEDLSKVWVVTDSEEPENPVIDELRQMGCKILMENVPLSIAALANAKTGGMCKSSFSQMSFYFSDKIKKIYCPDYVYEEDGLGAITDINVCKVNLPGYIKNGTWEASDSQLETMIKYDIEKITIEEGVNHSN